MGYRILPPTLRENPPTTRTRSSPRKRKSSSLDFRRPSAREDLSFFKRSCCRGDKSTSTLATTTWPGDRAPKRDIPFRNSTERRSRARNWRCLTSRLASLIHRRISFPTGRLPFPPRSWLPVRRPGRPPDSPAALEGRPFLHPLTIEGDSHKFCCQMNVETFS